ncbi:hypothetical protein SKAU_G00012030 [Synaphobranchus kaupii]|uniref:Uncharacterized protein n=1 Tax=Synaphobranchus kaupii TaxID=118154 RepID=A0A9Q1GBA7_SYNKA|nr:hypothetical protein SKAU_G00012030 [Synaphobranchus kaupii]
MATINGNQRKAADGTFLSNPRGSPPPPPSAPRGFAPDLAASLRRAPPCGPRDGAFGRVERERGSGGPGELRALPAEHPGCRRVSGAVSRINPRTHGSSFCLSGDAHTKNFIRRAGTSIIQSGPIANKAREEPTPVLTPPPHSPNGSRVRHNKIDVPAARSGHSASTEQSAPSGLILNRIG